MLLFLWLARLRERWLGKCAERSRKHPRRARRFGRRLEVETLEDRVVPSGAPALNGTWAQLPSPPSGSLGTLLLLPNGDVMAQGPGVTNTWYELTPNANGSYANGSWSQLASMNVGRLYVGSAVLPSDKVFVVGGEYSSTGGFNGTGEVYDMASNSWSMTPNFPLGGFGDDPTDLLPNGDVLCGFVGGSQTELYNPTSNTWSPGPTKLDGDGSDEETWVKLPVSAALPQGGILSYSIFASFGGTFKGQVFNIATNTWMETKNSASNPPGPLSSGAVGAELGGGLMLPSGKVLQLGATGNTALYDPATNTWSAGPQILDANGKLLGCDDAPASILPDGQVVFSADFGPTSGTFASPTELFDYDYNTNTISQITNLPGTLTNDLNGAPAFIDRTLVLPNGQLLFNDGGRLFTFTPSDSPQNAWRPTISGITNNGNGTYTLTGTQLSGISEGSSYGDDVNVSENYPIVQVKAGDGTVYYATTSNWSNVLVSQVGDATPENVTFTLPAGVTAADGAYQLTVSASGISSNAQTFYVGTPATVSTQNALTTFRPSKQSLSLTANISSAQPVNEGTVTFTIKDKKGDTIGIPAQGNVAGNPSGGGGTASATYSLPANAPAGIYTIYVSYSDSTGRFFDNGDTSGTLTILPAQVSTTANALTASYSPNAQTLTLSANLSDNSFSSDTIGEGSVTFTVEDSSGKNLGSVVGKVSPGAVNGGTASASFTLPAGQTPGSYTILVHYNDFAGNYNDSSDTSAILTLSPAKIVSTAAGVVAAYSTNSQTLSFNATFADSSIPTDVLNEGIVTFTISNSSGIVGTVNSPPVIKDHTSVNFILPAGQAAGNYTIAVAYNDSLGNYVDGGDGNATLELDPARVSTTAITPATVVYSSSAQSLNLSASLADNSFPKETVMEGTVTFTVLSGSTVVGIPTPGIVKNGTASAVFSVPPNLPPGSYTVAVAYTDSLGNYTDAGDTSAPLTVTHASVTTTAGNSSLNYSTEAQTATLNAKVADPNNSSDIVGEGVVTFTVMQGSTIVGNVQGTVNGGNASAAFAWTAGRAAGNYTIAVSYIDPSGNYTDTLDTSGTLTVNPAHVATTAVIPPAVIHSSNAQNITLRANVADTTFSSDTVNEGVVTFTVEDQNGNPIGKPVTNTVSGGIASGTFALPPGQAVGTYTIVVGYKDSQGNFSDNGDTSTTLTVLPANVATTANSVAAIYSPNGQTLNLSANVANLSVPSQAVGEGIVTFTVTDKNGKPVGKSVTGSVSGGVASAAFALPPGQAAGSYTVSVQYSDSQGSFRDNGDTSSTLTVSPANVTTTANNVSAFFSPNNQTLTLTATVADAGIPSDTVSAGSVTFTIKTSNVTLGSVTGSVNGGKASADFTLLAGQSVGSYIIAVSYNDPSGNFSDSGDSNALLTVASAKVATTAANISTTYSTNTQTLALSAQVADTSIPTDTVDEGTVTFSILNGSTTLGSEQVAVKGGVANTTFTLAASQPAGSYTIAVRYSDSSVNFSDGGDTNGALTVSPATVTATANPASAVYSTNTEIVKLSANVVNSSIPSDTVNEGVVTFTLMNGSKSLGSVQGTVAGGTANAVLTVPANLTPGNYTVTVSYSDSNGNGNGNFTSNGSGGGSGTAFAVTSAQVATTALSNSSAVYSQSAQTVMLSADVADTSVPSDTVNAGIVTFTILNGATTIGSVQGTVASGTASAPFTLRPGLSASNYTIAVSYNDSQGNYSSGGVTYATLTVSPANATTTAANANTTYSTTPQTVSLSAAVADPGPVNNVVGEGSVTFAVLNGNTVIGSTAGTVHGGTASAALTLPGGLAIGNYTIAVSYSSGQGNFTDSGDDYASLSVGAAGTSAQLTQVTLAPTLLSLTATETLTAHVSSSTPVTQGSVTFFVSNHAITANVDGNGNATATVTLPMLQLLGPQDISVRYSDATNNRTPSTDAQAAAWHIFNPIVPSTATFAPTSDSVTADLFGLFIIYTNGLLTEIDYGSIHLVFSYNAFGGLAQVTYNGMNLM